MFTINPIVKLHNNPTCNKEVAAVRLFSKSVDYFDKDRFQLTEIECEYYFVNGYNISNTLNHRGYQQPWLVLNDINDDFYSPAEIINIYLLHKNDPKRFMERLLINKK